MAPPDNDAVFSGRAFQVRVEERPGPDGRPHRYEIVDRVPAVAVVADVDGALLAIRQERPAVRRVLYELPAGKVDPGESPEQAARRELAEETGYRAEHLVRLFDLYPSPGYTNELVSFFFTADPAAGLPHRESGEEAAGMEVVLLSPPQVRQMILGAEPLNALFHTGATVWLGRHPRA
jgi:ADP-ribose pyrophosphatase